MLLRTENISKQFNGVYALKDVSMEIAEGEIHGLIGENGAGKSTLIKILTGVYSLDEGEICWNGRRVSFDHPEESRRIGINVIHQDHVLVPSFKAVENVWLGLEYPTSRGRIDWKRMREQVEKKAEEIGIPVNLDTAAADMTPQQKTCLEIVRAMMTDCRMLILDEPTATLNDRESEILFRVIGNLKSRGTSVLYVTHRMDEILLLTDRVTVLRNGMVADVVKTSEITKEELIRSMSDEWQAETISRGSGDGEVRLEVRGLSSKDGTVRDMSIKAHAGEILGVFGLGGSGRTEFLECVYGYRPVKGGEVVIDGKPAGKLTPSESIRKGMVLISEDRRGKSLIGSMRLRENITLSSIGSYVRHGIIDRKKEKGDTSGKMDLLAIRATGTEQRVLELSGGNQQKAVFARALMTDPGIFLCDEPTQAVDVMTRSEIHHLLRKKADEGSAVVFVSSDIKEILEVSDNIQIVSGGYTKELLKNENLTTNEVLACCYDR